jgi:hypothetical protein
MNSNLQTFRSIKLETVHYILNLGIEDIKTMHLKIIDSVKDKSKQITLAIYCMKQSYIVQNIALYDGVAKLYFNNWPQDYNENFSFCLFSNICHLSLADVYGIPKANFYLEKATKLEMWCCEFEEITAWNATKSGLKELRVSRCDSLKRLPPLGNITSVEIKFDSINAIQFEVGRQTKFSFCGQSLTADTWQSMFAHPSFFRDIQKLSLSCDFSAEFQDFPCCRDIHVLELLNQVEGGHPKAFPILSSFNGRKLILKQFNLFSWNVVQEFPNVVECSLYLCSNLFRLLEMPKLRSLDVCHCHSLPEIPSFPSLPILSIQVHEGIDGTPKIVSSPHLQEVVIFGCEHLADISRLTDAQTLSISDYPVLLSIPSLKIMKELNIFDCNRLSDMKAMTLDWKDYMKEERTVNLSSLPVLFDFSFCRNIYSLDLSRLSGLKTCTGISNIHHLKLDECENLISTEGLGSVTGKIELQSCASLTSLTHVKNIREVHISFCKNIRNFNDLGNHELLQIQRSDRFEKLLEEYQREGQHNQLFSSIRSLFWISPTVFGEPVRIW